MKFLGVEASQGKRADSGSSELSSSVSRAGGPSAELCIVLSGRLLPDISPSSKSFCQSWCAALLRARVDTAVAEDPVDPEACTGQCPRDAPMLRAALGRSEVPQPAKV